MVSILAGIYNTFCLPRIFPPYELPHPHPTLHQVELSIPRPCLPHSETFWRTEWTLGMGQGHAFFSGITCCEELFKLIPASSHQESDLEEVNRGKRGAKRWRQSWLHHENPRFSHACSQSHLQVFPYMFCFSFGLFSLFHWKQLFKKLFILYNYNNFILINWAKLIELNITI